MTNIRTLAKRVERIEQRNRRVTQDKAWETSIFRKGLIAIFTYIAIGAYLDVIKVPNAWLSAIVPTVAFLLSTLTFPYFKQIWLRYFYRV